MSGVPSSLELVFQFYDKDESGYLDTSELGNVMNAMGQCMDEAEVQAIVQSIDADGNKKISYEEFQELFKRYRKDMTQICKELSAAFQKFDKNGSGSISVSELFESLTKTGSYPMTEEDAELFIEMFDANGDGKLSVEELTKLLAAKCETIDDVSDL